MAFDLKSPNQLEILARQFSEENGACLSLDSAVYINLYKNLCSTDQED